VAHGDLLVGADGTNSKVRRQCRPDAEPHDTGVRGIFGRTYVTAINLPVLEPLLRNAGMMALGPRGSVFFCTSMRFRQSPAVEAARLGIEGQEWPSQDYFMWAVTVRDSRTEGRGSLMPQPEALHELAMSAIEGFHDDYQALVQSADRNDLVLVPIRAAQSVRLAKRSSMTLIGDAAHTMPPFGAHGANTALKDAQVLANQLSSRPSIEEAIREYEAAMDRYSRQLVRSASRMMLMATANFPLKRTIFRTALRAATLFSRS